MASLLVRIKTSLDLSKHVATTNVEVPETEENSPKYHI